MEYSKFSLDKFYDERNAINIYWVLIISNLDIIIKF